MLPQEASYISITVYDVIVVDLLYFLLSRPFSVHREHSTQTLDQMLRSDSKIQLVSFVIVFPILNILLLVQSTSLDISVWRLRLHPGIV